MNFCSIFNKKPKNGQLATQHFQKIPTLNTSKQIPLSDTILNMTKLAAIQSFPQKKFGVGIEPTQSEVVTKTVRKSNYEELIKSLSQKKQKFIDKDFPPQGSSIGPNIKSKITSWKRIPQIIQNPVFIQKGISPGDLLQGGINDCYFLGALSCLAEKPYRVAKCLDSIKISPYGLYMARFVVQGILTQVIVDDYIPLTNNKLFFARNSGSQIWPIILQKCWAKIFKNYQNIAYIGYPHQSFYALTGAPTFSYYFKGKPQEQIGFWNNLKQAESKNYPIAFGTTVQPKKNQPVGIVSQHIYTLLEIHQVKGYKLVRLRNPWGEFEWKGRASDSDTNFWDQFSLDQKTQLSYQVKNQGIFYMIWEDCPTYFDFIQICQLKDNAHLLALRSTFNRKNAQLFQLQTTGGQVSVSLIQDYSFKGELVSQIQKSSPCFILVAKYNPQKNVGYQFDYVDSAFKTMPFRATNLKLNLSKGKYVIYSKYWWIDTQSKEATINIYTESTVQLKAVNQSQYPQLLQKTYLFLARSHPEYIQPFGQSEDTGDLKIFTSKQLEQGGYGYIVIKLNSKAKGKVLLQFDEKDFKDKELTLKKPYKGQKHIKIIVAPGQQHIILFQCKLKNYSKNVSAPEPKITKLV